jgi:hypothetical protein
MCNKIIPGDVLHLGNKTCIAFSGDQPTAVTHRQISSECSPSCNCHDESTSHTTWCRDPGWMRILKDLVEYLVQCQYDQQKHSKVVQLFKQYLLAGGTRKLTSLHKPASKLEMEAQFHDHLGWGCFLEGQLCALWVEHRAQHIQWANLTGLALGTRTHATAPADDPCTVGI